jgi:putative transposase
VQFDKGELGGAIDGYQEVKALLGTDFAWDTRGADRPGDPQVAQRQLLPLLSGATAHGREGVGGGDLGGHVHGVSTRSVDDLVKAMGASGVSKS